VPDKPTQPLRLFLDAGVVIDGAYNRWGSPKGVLILVAMRTTFRAVIAEPVHTEILRNIVKKTATFPTADARMIMRGLTEWYTIARPTACPGHQPRRCTGTPASSLSCAIATTWPLSSLLSSRVRTGCSPPTPSTGTRNWLIAPACASPTLLSSSRACTPEMAF